MKIWRQIHKRIGMPLLRKWEAEKDFFFLFLSSTVDSWRRSVPRHHTQLASGTPEGEDAANPRQLCCRLPSFYFILFILFFFPSIPSSYFFFFFSLWATIWPPASVWKRSSTWHCFESLSLHVNTLTQLPNHQSMSPVLFYYLLFI